MSEGFAGIIDQLERRKTAIERALAALRDIEGTEAPASAQSFAVAPAKRRGRPKGTGLNRRSEGQKKRWVAKKAAEAAPAEAPQKPVARKVAFTPEGRQRLAEAMRRRWAVKRAASAVKKAGRKRAAKKAS